MGCKRDSPLLRLDGGFAAGTFMLLFGLVAVLSWTQA